VKHRQRVGLVVIGMALVLVAAVTGLRPNLVSGAGQAGPIPGPPVVGDCVLYPLPDSALVASTATASPGGTVPVYPAQEIQPCTAARYGEIVSVIANPKPTVVKGDYANDPNAASCFLAANQYVGMTTKPILGFWQASLLGTAALFGPSLRQKTVGQHWAACIVSLPPPTPTLTDPAPPPEQYDSSIHNALHTGQQRDQLGICPPAGNEFDGGLDTGGCRRPHAFERLGSGVTGDRPVSREQLQLTCQQLVRQLTAMPDPTAAGALSIQINIQDMNSVAVTTQQVPANSVLRCGVATTGTRKLRGSLLALGRQPIPWA